MALYKSFKICTILVCPRSYPHAQSPDAIGGGYPDETIYYIFSNKFKGFKFCLSVYMNLVNLSLKYNKNILP